MVVAKPCLIFFLLTLWLPVFPVFAAESEFTGDASSLDDSAAAIYGQACEKIKQGELRSSVRMRATDKASFSAVKTLHGLNDFHPKASEHDFNVLIYNIVDNYVEDLAVRTTKQNQEEICVEVTGFVLKKNIVQAIEDAISAEKETQLTEEETPYLAEKDIKSEPQDATSSTAKENAQAPVSEEKIVYAPKSVPTQENKALYSEEINADTNSDETIEPKGLVYIAPTEFFNNTSSTAHAKILRDLFGENTLFYLTDKRELANYVISSKVLRAKVDPINNTTNRLQMVVSVGAEFVDSGSSSIEHQNRFILFSSDDDEQLVAGKLMNKLLSKAGETILNKIEADARHNNKISSSSSILTPVS